MAHSLLKEEFEFEQRNRNLPDRILATEKTNKTVITSRKETIDDELESMSDIDESMERYMKYRMTNRQRQTSKGPTERAMVAKEETALSSNRGGRDPHIKISVLLQKQNEKLKEAQIFKNDYTTIEVDASNDNNTSIQNLRKQMSKPRPPNEVASSSDSKPEAAVDPVIEGESKLGVNRFSYKELMNQHRDKLDQLEKKNSQQQLTSRNVQDESEEAIITEPGHEGRHSVQLSYVQSSLENTQTRRSRPMQPSMQGISKYQTTDYNISEANEEDLQNRVDQLQLNETDILIQSLNEQSGSANSSPENYRKQTDVADFKEFTIRNEEESLEETKRRIKEIGMTYGINEPKFNAPDIQTSLVCHKVVRDISKDLIDIQVIMAKNSERDLNLVSDYDFPLNNKPSTIQEADTQQELDTEDINGTEHAYGGNFKLNARSRQSLGRYSIGQKDTGFPSRNESALEMQDDDLQSSSKHDELKRMWVKNVTNSSYKSLDKEEKLKNHRVDHISSMKQIEPANSRSLFQNLEPPTKFDQTLEKNEKFAMTGEIPQSTTTFANQQLGATLNQSNHMTLQSHQSSSTGGQYLSLRNRTLKASDLQAPLQIKEKYDQMVFQNPHFGNKNKKGIPKVPRAKSPPKFEIPDQKLMVVCLIKREADAVQRQGRSRSVKVHPRLGKTAALQTGGPKRFASNSNLGSHRERSNSTLGNKSQASSRSYGASSHCSSQLLNGQKSRQLKASNIKTTDSQEEIEAPAASEPRSHLLFFTTPLECSQFVFRQNFSNQFDPISNKIISSTLRTSSDVQKFVNGVQQTPADGSEDPRLRMFRFDKCISSYQHQRKMRQETHAMIRAWLLAGEEENPSRANSHICFLFGSASTSKSRDMNLMHNDSLIQQFIREFPAQFEYLKVSMFFQDQEFILNQREFSSTKQSNREIGMEIRESLRDKNRLITKLSAQQPELQLYIQKCSHFRIQINNYVFVDMADLRGLQCTENQEIVDTLTNDFGSMTNEILRQSNFYKNHDFALSPEQMASSLNSFLMETITKESKILLLTYINNSPEDDATNSIALDFSHKIKQYFNGNPDECQIQTYLTGDPECRDHFDKLATVFQKVSKMKLRVRRELTKARRLSNSHFSRHSYVQPGSFQKFEQLFDEFSGFVNEVLEFELIRTFEMEQIDWIKGKIDSDMAGLQKQVKEIARLQEKHQVHVANFIRIHGHQVAPVTKAKKPKNSTSPHLRNPELINQAPLTMDKIKMVTQSVNNSLQLHKISIQSGAVPRSNSNLGFKNQARPTSSLGRESEKSVKRPGSQGATSQTKKKSFEKKTKPSNRLKNSNNSQNSFASKRQQNVKSPSLQNMKMKMEDQSKLTIDQIEAATNQDLVASFPKPDRLKLANEIDQGLTKIKQKRAEARNESRYQEDTHMTTQTSERLVSLSDIQNNNVVSGAHLIYSERQSTQQLMGGKNKRILLEDRDEDLVPQKDGPRGRAEKNNEKGKNVQKNRNKSKASLVRVNTVQNSNRSKSRGRNSKSNERLQGIPAEFQKTTTGVNMQPPAPRPYEDNGNFFRNRNLDQFCSPDLLSSQTSNTQNLMLNNTTDRYQQYQTKAIQNEIKQLKQQLQFQKSEFETAMALKDLELHKSAQSCKEARKELKMSMKQNQELTSQNEDLLTKLAGLKQQKDKTETLNHQILDQIKMMKSAIAEQRQTEQMNKELLEKSRLKSEKILELKDAQSQLMEQIKGKNSTIQKLTKQLAEMEQRFVTLGGGQQSEFELMYFELKKKYDKEVQEHARFLQQVQTNSTNSKSKLDDEKATVDEDLVEEMREEIESLKKARDRFRSQVLDQKQEIRSLRGQLHEAQKVESEEKGHHKVISELEGVSAYQDCLKLDLTMSHGDSKCLNYNSMISDAKLSSISNQIKSQVAKCKNSDRNERVQTVQDQKENSQIFNQVVSFGNSKMTSLSVTNHNSNISRKNEVIADIKSLIKDFKRDISK